MTTIHHATAKRAAANGIVFTQAKGIFTAVDQEDAKRTTKGRDPKALLAEMLDHKANGTYPELDPRRSVVPAGYKAVYAKSLTPDSCDDDMAAVLYAFLMVDDQLDQGRLARVASDNGIDTSPYAGLNPGHRRMCIGNKLRGMNRRGEAVRINGQTIAGMEAE